MPHGPEPALVSYLSINRLLIYLPLVTSDIVLLDSTTMPGDAQAGPSASGGSPQKDAQPRKHRKLNRSAHQLKRNAACIPCRRRRIKCDAGRPHCASCTRSFHFLQRTNPDAERDSAGIQCFYEDDDEDGAGAGEDQSSQSLQQTGAARAQDKETTVKKLEARVGESTL